jgi:hypothetical protein
MYFNQKDDSINLRGITMATTFNKRKSWLMIAAAGLFVFSVSVKADSGFYFGASMGGATLEAGFDQGDFPQLPSSIDEDDTAFKIFTGYKLDLPVLTLGVEGSYANFGEPEIDVTGVSSTDEVSIETTALTVWGTVGIEVGPADLYAKFGLASWDSDASSGFSSISEDGSDPAYGVGAAFGLGPLEVRGEYEIYDFDGADISMISVGVAYWF